MTQANVVDMKSLQTTYLPYNIPKTAHMAAQKPSPVTSALTKYALFPVLYTEESQFFCEQMHELIADELQTQSKCRGLTFLTIQLQVCIFKI